MIDTLILNIIHTLFPYTIYLFYVAYKSKDDKRENELLVTLTIFSSLYVTLKYNTQILASIPMLFVNVPLIISFYKKNTVSIIVSSFILIAYYYNFYHNYLLLFIIEYLIYFMIYKRVGTNILIFACAIIKAIVIIIISFLGNTIIQNILDIVICDIIFIIVTTFIFYLIKKAEDILRVHMLYKEISYDKQVKTSLFQITHEIKNPIAVCKGYLDMFDVNNKEHAEKYVPIIREEISKVLLLLQDFLAMNKVKINKEIMDVNYLLEDIKDNYNLYFKANNIDILFNISGDEVYINGDYNRLTQVFVNIINNSIEALKDNPQIRIWTKILDGNIYIYFKDNGVGISDDIINKIKEPFFTTKIKGTGLGVSLSDEIIKAHNGTLIYQSEEDKYTLVTVMLPLVTI